MTTQSPVERARTRLNFWLLLIPQQWITLVVIYWMQRLMRPGDTIWGLPPATIVAGAVVLCALPAFLPTAWFTPKAFERNLYERLGVRLFRHLAPDGRWVSRRLRQLDPTWRIVRDAETRARHLARSITNERWHLSWLIFGLVAQAAAVAREQVAWAVVLTVFNVIFNLYPVLHQRYVRARATRRRPA